MCVCACVFVFSFWMELLWLFPKGKVKAKWIKLNQITLFRWVMHVDIYRRKYVLILYTFVSPHHLTFGKQLLSDKVAFRYETTQKRDSSSSFDIKAHLQLTLLHLVWMDFRAEVKKRDKIIILFKCKELEKWVCSLCKTKIKCIVTFLEETDLLPGNKSIN